MMWTNLPRVLMLMGCSMLAIAEDRDYRTLEFLEFLGEWENEHGEWVDPLALPDENDERDEQDNPGLQISGEETE